MRAAPRGVSPRGRAALGAGLGLALLAASGVAACQARPAGDAGTPVAAAAPPAASAAPSAPAAGGPGTVAVQDGALPTGGAETAPARLRIPKLDLDAAVRPVGVDTRTNDFAVPPSIDTVGWYKFGPGLTATAGSIVVAGHVDSAEQGKGAFFRLQDLGPGDTVTVTAPGTTRSFTVVSRERRAKATIPLDRYFARDGAVRLTLITCGGPFDPKTGHYRDNVVVTARAR